MNTRYVTSVLIEAARFAEKPVGHSSEFRTALDGLVRDLRARLGSFSQHAQALELFLDEPKSPAVTEFLRELMESLRLPRDPLLRKRAADVRRHLPFYVIVPKAKPPATTTVRGVNVVGGSMIVLRN
jgi:hypothetical protein